MRRAWILTLICSGQHAVSGFFGFVRVGEFTEPSDGSFDPEAHLSYSNIVVNNSSRLQLVRITIK